VKKLLAKIRSVLVVRVNRMDGFVPPYYGVAWRSEHVDQLVCMLVPLNAIAGLLRGSYFYLRRFGARVSADPRVAYEEGVRSGKASKITDEDIRVYLLRKKVTEANGDLKVDDFGATQTVMTARMNSILNEMLKLNTL